MIFNSNILIHRQLLRQQNSNINNLKKFSNQVTIKRQIFHKIYRARNNKLDTNIFDEHLIFKNGWKSRFNFHSFFMRIKLIFTKARYYNDNKISF